MHGAGGTSGGIAEFFIGSGMSFSGLYLLLQNIKVTSGFFAMRYSLFGDVSVTAFGVCLIPFIIGLVVLFYDASLKLGWALTLISLCAILLGILSSLHVVFATTSLFVLLTILVLLFGGLGLILRSLKPH